MARLDSPDLNGTLGPAGSRRWSPGLFDPDLLLLTLLMLTSAAVPQPSISASYDHPPPWSPRAWGSSSRVAVQPPSPTARCYSPCPAHHPALASAAGPGSVQPAFCICVVFRSLRWTSSTLHLLPLLAPFTFLLSLPRLPIHVGLAPPPAPCPTCRLAPRRGLALPSPLAQLDGPARRRVYRVNRADPRHCQAEHLPWGVLAVRPASEVAHLRTHTFDESLRTPSPLRRFAPRMAPPAGPPSWWHASGTCRERGSTHRPPVVPASPPGVSRRARRWNLPCMLLGPWPPSSIPQRPSAMPCPGARDLGWPHA